MSLSDAAFVDVRAVPAVHTQEVVFPVQEEITNVVIPQLEVIDGQFGVVNLGDSQFLSESFGQPLDGVLLDTSQPEFFAISEPETISVSQPEFVSVAQPDPFVVLVDQR